MHADFQGGTAALRSAQVHREIDTEPHPEEDHNGN